MKYKVICSSNPQLKTQLKSLLNTTYIEDDIDYQYLFIIGGDGTFISEALLHWDKSIKIIHIKAGTNTFFGQSLTKESIESALLDNAQFSPYQVMKIESDHVEPFYAINEIYVQGHLLLEASIFINNVEYQQIRAHSLICCTQIGCTGLNKSLGFPIFLNSLGAWALGIIAPQNNINCVQINVPLIISDQEIIKLKIKGCNCSIYIDNKLNSHLTSSKELNLSIRYSKAKIYKFGCSNSYLENLTHHFNKSL